MPSNEHTKTWGKEIWIVNKEYCGKKLILDKGYRCSMHYHKKKEETFYVISGIVLMELNGKIELMFPGDSVHVLPYDRHRFTGIKDSEIIEFSTHHDDEDSYRLTKSEKVPDEEFACFALLSISN